MENVYLWLIHHFEMLATKYLTPKCVTLVIKFQ